MRFAVLKEALQFSPEHRGCFLSSVDASVKLSKRLDSHPGSWVVNQVFSRERLNGHYGVAVFVIGNSLSSIPFLFLISVVSGAIVYFMVQLHPGFGHFSYFVIALFACMLVVEGLMMAVASIVPNFLMGIITGAGIQVRQDNPMLIHVHRTF